MWYLVGIYGVGKAAVHLPALAVLSHTVPSASRTIAWVGKGIVYDTGGLSIKAKVRFFKILNFNIVSLPQLHVKCLLSANFEFLLKIECFSPIYDFFQ